MTVRVEVTVTVEGKFWSSKVVKMSKQTNCARLIEVLGEVARLGEAASSAPILSPNIKSNVVSVKLLVLDHQK